MADQWRLAEWITSPIANPAHCSLRQLRSIFDLMIENLTTDVCAFNSASPISIIRAIHIVQKNCNTDTRRFQVKYRARRAVPLHSCADQDVRFEGMEGRGNAPDFSEQSC